MHPVTNGNEAGTSKASELSSNSMKPVKRSKNKPPPSTHHGIDYQLKITLWILLNAKRIMFVDNDTECSVTAEDPSGGKFDDTVLRLRLPGGREQTLYIQAKHKIDNAYLIKMTDLLPGKDSSIAKDKSKLTEKDTVFSLIKYFKSFCALHRNGKTEGAMFAVCTNAGVSKDVAKVLEEVLHSSTYLSFFHRVGAFIYRFDVTKLRGIDRFNRLFDLTNNNDAAKLLDLFFDKFVMITDMKGMMINKDINTLWRCLEVPSSSLFTQQMGFIERSIAIDHLSSVAWTMTKFSTTTSHTDIEHIFQTIVRNLCYLQLKGVSSSICKNFENSDFGIKPSVLEQSQAYQACLTGGLHKHYSMFDREVSCNIILQILRLIEFEYIFIDSCTYLEQAGVIRDIFCFLESHFILVIAIRNEKDIPNITKSAEDLINENACGFKKTVMLITSNEGQSKGVEYRLSDLTNQSEQELFGKYSQVKLYYTHFSLKNLLKGENVGLVMLDRLIKAAKVEESKSHPSVESFEKIQKYYVGRVWESSNTMVRENLSASEDFYSVRQSLLSSLENFEDRVGFDKLAALMRLPEKSFNSEFYFQVVKKVFNHVHEPPPGMDTSDKVFIFLEEAGYGKTTYMTWLAWYFIVHRPSCWVIRLNAIEYSYEFSQIIQDQGPVLDANKAVRILFQLIYLMLSVPNLMRRTIEETETESGKVKRWYECLTLSDGKVVINATGIESVEQQIALSVFRDKFNDKQIVLILDGFDEIVPHYKDVVLHLFSLFAQFEGIHKLYFTSRPYNFIDELKSAFQVTDIYRMVPFTEQNQYHFLHNYLESNIIEYGSCIQRKQLFAILFTIYKSLLGGLHCIPLFCKMALAILIPSIKAHVNLINYTISKRLIEEVNIMFNRSRIIEGFVNQMLNIANYEKSGCCNTASFIAQNQTEVEAKNKAKKEELSLLGINTIIPSHFQLISMEEQKLCENYMQEIAKGQKKTGIVEGVQAGVPLFIHRMFAEYFAACWLFDNRARPEVQAFLKKSWYWEEDNNIVRTLFNEIAIRDKQGKDSPIHLAITQNDKIKLKHELELNKSLHETKDVLGRTPLHLAVQYKDDMEIIKMLLEKVKKPHRALLINIRDELLQWSTVDYAILINKEQVIEFLLTNGGFINSEVLKEQLKGLDRLTMFETLIRYDKYVRILRYGVKYEYLQKRSSKQFKMFKQLLNATIADVKKNQSEWFYKWRDELLWMCIYADSGTLFGKLLPRLNKTIFLLRRSDMIREAFKISAGFVLDTIMNNSYYAMLKSNDQYIYNYLLQCIDFKAYAPFDRYFLLYLRKRNITGHMDWDQCDSKVSRLIFHAITHGNLLIVQQFFDDNARFFKFAGLYVKIDGRFIFAVLGKVASLHEPYHVSDMFKYVLCKVKNLHKARDEQGCDLLHRSAQLGFFGLLVYLIDFKHFYVNTINKKSGWNVFHYCVSVPLANFELPVSKEACYRSFYYLMYCRRIAGIHAFDFKGRNVFHLAVINKHFPSAKLILDHYLVNIPLEMQSAQRRKYIAKSGISDRQECAEFLRYSDELRGE